MIRGLQKHLGVENICGRWETYVGPQCRGWETYVEGGAKCVGG